MPRTGGGINSKPVSHVSAPKAEPTVHNISPNRPSQIGMSVHYVKSDLYQSSTTPKGPEPAGRRSWRRKNGDEIRFTRAAWIGCLRDSTARRQQADIPRVQVRRRP